VARLQFAARARRDIATVLDFSHDNFGQPARRRYEALIAAAPRDIANDARRQGATERVILGRTVRLYHLRQSRERARTEDGIGQSPRHAVVYRLAAGDTVIVVRVLHDSMDPARHLDVRPE
jgi:toxin ParE1/3/4